MNNGYDGKGKRAIPAKGNVQQLSHAAAETIRRKDRPLGVGDALTEMPSFSRTPKPVSKPPLKSTYQTAFAAMHQCWRRVLEP